MTENEAKKKEKKMPPVEIEFGPSYRAVHADGYIFSPTRTGAKIVFYKDRMIPKPKWKWELEKIIREILIELDLNAPVLMDLAKRVEEFAERMKELAKKQEKKGEGYVA